MKEKRGCQLCGESRGGKGANQRARNDVRVGAQGDGMGKDRIQQKSAHMRIQVYYHDLEAQELWAGRVDSCAIKLPIGRVEMETCG